MIETRQILEELQLKNVLATSSTGAVFLADDPVSGNEVVIKVVSCAVPGAEEDVRRLFLAMARAARSASVSSMPRVTDHGLTPEGDGFLVMDVVKGRTLDSVEELSAFATINILLDVLSCIEDLAAAGTAHLNLKPNNVFVTNPPSDDRAAVLGYGTSATLLHAGAGVPVPADDPHLAPELVAGNVLPAEQSWRSDLFSLGVIACSALGAEIEANGHDRPRVHIPMPIRELLPEVEPLEEALGRIMAPDPTLRGDSPGDLRDPLVRALPDPPALDRAQGAAGKPAFDPNRTDPSLEVPRVRVVERPAVLAQADDAGAVASLEVTESDENDDGWPEVLFDDPKLPASLCDDEDTDVRNPVPEDVWVPPNENGRREPIPPAAVAPAAARGSVRRRVSRLEIALVALVVVVLSSIIAFTWSTGGDDGVPPASGLAQVQQRGGSDALVPPPPDPNLFDDLLAIQRLVEAGDVEAARSALGMLDERADRTWSSDESALYDSLMTEIAQASDRSAAIDDLRSGLKYGSVKMVRRGAAGLGGLSADEVAEVHGLADDLERGRRALRLHSQMWDAHSAGDHVDAIASANELERLVPEYSGAAEVREQSAAALEASAEAFISGRGYDRAIAVLEGLSRVWPDRPGVAARATWCREQIAIAQRQESAIAAALAMGDAGDPEGGLARLDAMAPDGRLARELARARSVLDAQLAELDARAPSVEIAGDVELAFKKGESLSVPLRVTDDYRVEKVVVHARSEKDEDYLEIPLLSKGDGLYTFTVTPELHGNSDVVFFVVARDRSGHVGRLGAEESPQTITRKKWFKKLL